MPTATTRPVLRIAVPVPLRQLFDYLPPAEGSLPAPGCRCEVPFGNRLLVGIVWQHGQCSTDPGKLKRVRRVLDQQPVLDADLLALCEHSAHYYHHPIGEVLNAVLPALLRQGEPATRSGSLVWQLTAAGRFAQADNLNRAPRQKQVLTYLLEHRAGLAAELTSGLGMPRSALMALQKKGWIELQEVPDSLTGTHTLLAEVPPSAGTEQLAAIRALSHSPNFAPFLLDGITGSGKTEVYLQAMEPVLAAQRQVLVLVPEIGLTPQTLRRFDRRFNVPVVSLHSGLSDRARLDAWVRARRGEAAIIIGTRSAIFTPLLRPGLIIVDEAHDSSLKQQEGLRYSARDLAVWRARLLDIPVVLGSATPALETLHLAYSGRYRHLQLTERAGGASPPRIRLEDCRSLIDSTPLSHNSMAAIKATLARGEQALVFLNRRGYSPLILCHDCGFEAQCRHCSVRLTWHKVAGKLICHHCGAWQAVPRHCPDCGSSHLGEAGSGTERVEEVLQQALPAYPVIRVDRDSTRRRGSLDAALRKVLGGDPAILVGTQMLAKGHHFPRLALAIILGADSGFLSSDFRGPEQAGQLILQVAGRTGRSDIPGEVLIQSRHPEHPLLHTLLSGDYHQLAERLLEERQQLGLPPFGHLVLLRAESTAAGHAATLLDQTAAALELPPGAQLLGPVPAPIERRNGRYRFQLLLQASTRPPLHRAIDNVLALIQQHPLNRQCRWHLDVDPQDLL